MLCGLRIGLPDQRHGALILRNFAHSEDFCPFSFLSTLEIGSHWKEPKLWVVGCGVGWTQEEKVRYVYQRSAIPANLTPIWASSGDTPSISNTQCAKFCEPLLRKMFSGVLRKSALCAGASMHTIQRHRPPPLVGSPDQPRQYIPLEQVVKRGLTDSRSPAVWQYRTDLLQKLPSNGHS